ncbi:MAG: endonuclease [Candidatus Sabulitectum sp.]|nr:endonuclease [Candidatus Sabulitectum sp.]
MFFTKYFPVVALVLPLIASAQIPPGYYDPAEGLSGTALQWALHGIIDNHTVKSYDYIWTAFYTTDDRYGNKVWDMYSDIPGGSPPYLYTLGDDQGGSAGGEGEGYNREHSWPRSWFNDSSPMDTDLFHIVPSDIYVNNRRSNYPYAEVGSTTWTSQNGSRLGYSVSPGYSGMAFEPVDGYKGDFARNYFYMATRYKGEDGGWTGSAMADGADLEDWAVDLLMAWHQSDPVSDKEIERNEAVYDIQNNRNPFIDHPEYVQYVYDPQSGIEPWFEPVILFFRALTNPFTSSIAVNYSLAFNETVSLDIYDANGRLVHILQDNLPVAAGSHQAVWTGIDNSGVRVSPGVYFMVLTTASENSTLRLVCISR